MKHFTFDVTPKIPDENIQKAMEPFNEAKAKADAIAAQSPHLHWEYTVEKDSLNEARYILKIVGTPKLGTLTEGGA